MKREEYYKEIEKFLAEEKIGEMLIPRELVAELSERLAKLSLPPVEGAEAIVKKYEDEYDFKFHWVQRDRVIRMMREFAAQPQPKLDPKKVQWSGYGELGNISQKPLQPTAEGAEEILKNRLGNQYSILSPLGIETIIAAMREFATLHAQRIAEKKYADTEAGGYVFCGKCGKMKEI